MSTVSNPLSHSVSSAGFSDASWRYTAVFEGVLREKLMDSVSIRTSGFVPLVGDVAGTGSLTIRQRYLDAIGWGLSMTAMAAENTAITASALTATVEDVAVARYGIGWNNTYTNQVVAAAGEVTMDVLAAYNVLSYEAAWMDALATAIQAAATDSGTSGVDCSFDDVLDATYYFDLLEGMPGALLGLIHGQQKIDLKESMRNEQAFQFPEPTKELLSGAGGPGFWTVICGIAFYVSTRVAASGGNRHGCIMAPGAFIWAKGGTGSIVPANPANTVNLADQGIITEFTGTPGSATSTVYTNAFFGIDGGDGERARGLVTDQ